MVDNRNPLHVTPWRKLVAGSLKRKTRFHDELGQPIALSRAIRNAPLALWSGMLRLLLDHRPERPWISYDAQIDLARRMDQHSRVLEFGSGMSTIWLGRHAGTVVSVEDYQPWYDRVEPKLRAMGNVDYRFAPARESYVAVVPDEQFDLIMIDGNWRDDCARFAITHLRTGGIIYLDNCDMQADLPLGDIPEARRLLLDFARQESLNVVEYTDFAPTQLFVQRGMMVGG